MSDKSLAFTRLGPSTGNTSHALKQDVDTIRYLVGFPYKTRILLLREA